MVIDIDNFQFIEQTQIHIFLLFLPVFTPFLAILTKISFKELTNK